MGTGYGNLQSHGHAHRRSAARPALGHAAAAALLGVCDGKPSFHHICLHCDEKTHEIYAVSTWKGSDWYFNLQAAPALLLETGFISYVPQQRGLTPEEIAAAFIEFRKQHPYFGRMVCRIPGWK